jgi:hypothetical protein
MRFKGREIHPYESFYWNDTERFHRGELGGGIARSVKTDNSLATLVEVENENNPNPPSDEEGVHRNPDGGGYLTQVTPHRKLAEGECKREGQSARHSPATAREY